MKPVLTVVALVLPLAFTASTVIAAEKPNIVLMMVDELGYFEPGFMGGQTIQTPNLGKMAKDGLIFKNLFAGCPTVGVRTGAPFIQDGVTGVFVERLPPGAKCVKNDADEALLAAFVEGIQRSQQTDRRAVRGAASEVFGTEHIAGQIIDALATARSRGQPLVV
jgi:hypothetical protein